MKRVAPLLLAVLALAGCVPQPAPESPLHRSYSDEELAKLPLAQRCSYLSSLFPNYLANQKNNRNVEVDDAKMGLRTHVPSLEACVLSRPVPAGVNFSRTPSGSIVAPPSEAAGAPLEFVALP